MYNRMSFSRAARRGPRMNRNQFDRLVTGMWETNERVQLESYRSLALFGADFAEEIFYFLDRLNKEENSGGIKAASRAVARISDTLQDNNHRAWKRAESFYRDLSDTIGGWDGYLKGRADMRGSLSDLREILSKLV